MLWVQAMVVSIVNCLNHHCDTQTEAGKIKVPGSMASMLWVQAMVVSIVNCLNHHCDTQTEAGKIKVPGSMASMLWVQNFTSTTMEKLKKDILKNQQWKCNHI
jgi:hypothetical protein